MRRLAKHTRNDTYSSNRDYQTLHYRRARRIYPRGSARGRLVVQGAIDADSKGFVCWGGYLKTQRSVTVITQLQIGSASVSTSFQLDAKWARVGAMVPGAEPAGTATLRVEWSGGYIDFWGLALGRPHPPTDRANGESWALMRQSHLIPETYYLTHDAAADVEIQAETSGPLRTDEGSEIALKKCSYCGRLLPVDPRRLGVLAFHKHNAKRSKHQNECRACKKWRINDSFNPRRTTDQLHESSVITRERKLFLREPEILQRIKDRTGAGLKSKIWRSFGKKCFRCQRLVSLGDFQLDHTRPLAYLWPIDQHATCLCAECNNEKKEKFPVDFYTAEQLRRLSEITGLPIRQLSRKALNELELHRILRDLPKFSRDWEPRTFFATARKIAELRPDIDLFSLLRARDPLQYKRVNEELRDRPPPVDLE